LVLPDSPLCDALTFSPASPPSMASFRNFNVHASAQTPKVHRVVDLPEFAQAWKIFKQFTSGALELRRSDLRQDADDGVEGFFQHPQDRCLPAASPGRIHTEAFYAVMCANRNTLAPRDRDHWFPTCHFVGIRFEIVELSRAASRPARPDQGVPSRMAGELLLSRSRAGPMRRRSPRGSLGSLQLPVGFALRHA
jgi:hypothetical protein